jgi:hypothetical protein
LEPGTSHCITVNFQRGLASTLTITYEHLASIHSISRYQRTSAVDAAWESPPWPGGYRTLEEIAQESRTGIPASWFGQ